MQILETKLYPPPLRDAWVPRPRLLERLQAGISGKLTLVSAPAGSGKTTLISSWVHGSDWPAVWISLDEGDNDPVRFLTYLLAALQMLEDEIGFGARRLLEVQARQDLESLLAALLNDLAARQRPLVLIFDDYHSIKELRIHEAVGFLLEGLPPLVHLVLITRHDPPLALSRLRGRGQMTELRQDDLRFTTDEAAEFMQRSADVRLSAEEIAILEERTEGWITGLHLSALSLHGRDAAGVADFIHGFSGRHHYVLDYITDEVLSRQPRRIQRFLLRTCILDRMCGDLCDALLHEQTEGQLPELDANEVESRLLLAYLDRQNLFVVPLDDERTWYRYHHLFADLLRMRLREAHPEKVPELHMRAAAWFEENDLDADAVRHALATGRMDYAAQVIERAILDIATWSKLEVSTFRSWLSQLPAGLVRSRPWLQLLSSRTEYVMGDWQVATRLLDELEDYLKANPTDADAEHIGRLVIADRASYAAVRGDVVEAMAYAQQALAELSDSDPVGQMRMRAILGIAHARAGRVTEASRAFSAAIEASHTAGMGFAAALFVCHLADIHVEEGKLHLAMETCERARSMGEIGGAPGSHLGFVGLPEGRVLYQWNQLEAAEQTLLEGLELLGSGQIPEHFGNMYAMLAHVQSARGREDAADEAIQRAVQLALAGGIPRLVSLARADQARLYLVQGRLELASLWAAEYCQLAETQYLRDHENLTLARVRIAEDRLEEALDLLAKLLDPARAAGRMGAVIEGEALRALALQNQGKASEALAALTEALQLASPEGYIRVFVDMGVPMFDLLKQAASVGVALTQVGQLLAAFRAGPAMAPPRAAGVAVVSQPLVEPLTPRELEVLHLLEAGLSNQQIARRLFISLPTVKSHTRNIYGKLDVHSRDNAVEQGRALGLLSDPPSPS